MRGASGLEIEFAPSSNLAPFAQYRLVVTPALRDLQGSALEAAFEADFTTGQTLAGPVASVTVLPRDSATVVYGSRLQLIAVARDGAGASRADAAVTWASSADSVASVSPDGLVTALATGSTRISATAEGKVASMTVTVPAPPFSLGLVFSSDRDGIAQLYALGLVGTGILRLTYDSYRDEQPAVSPNGRSIAFVSDRVSGTGYRDLYVLDVATRRLTQLTQNGGAARSETPAWSPDGRRIAFSTASDSGPSHVFVVNADGTGLVALTPGSPGADWSPHWSPDGTKIVFTSARNSVGLTIQQEIFVMNADGSGVRQLTFGTHLVAGPWSPYGSKILLVGLDTVPRGQGATKVLVMNADGTGLVQLTSGSDNYCPVWSTDGAKIAFTSTRDGNAEIYLMNADGSGQVNLSNNPAKDECPQFWRRP